MHCAAMIYTHSNIITDCDITIDVPSNISIHCDIIISGHCDVILIDLHWPNGSLFRDHLPVHLYHIKTDHIYGIIVKEIYLLFIDVFCLALV